MLLSPPSGISGSFPPLVGLGGLGGFGGLGGPGITGGSGGGGIGLGTGGGLGTGTKKAEPPKRESSAKATRMMGIRTMTVW